MQGVKGLLQRDGRAGTGDLGKGVVLKLRHQIEIRHARRKLSGLPAQRAEMLDRLFAPQRGAPALVFLARGVGAQLLLRAAQTLLHDGLHLRVELRLVVGAHLFPAFPRGGGRFLRRGGRVRHIVLPGVGSLCARGRLRGRRSALVGEKLEIGHKQILHFGCLLYLCGLSPRLSKRRGGESLPAHPAKRDLPGLSGNAAFHRCGAWSRSCSPF